MAIWRGQSGLAPGPGQFTHQPPISYRDIDQFRGQIKGFVGLPFRLPPTRRATRSVSSGSGFQPAFPPADGSAANVARIASTPFQNCRQRSCSDSGSLAIDAPRKPDKS